MMWVGVRPSNTVCLKIKRDKLTSVYQVSLTFIHTFQRSSSYIVPVPSSYSSSHHRLLMECLCLFM